MMTSRRDFLRGAGAAVLSAGLVSRVQAAGIPEAKIQDNPLTEGPLAPQGGPDYQPVVTLNGWTLPYRMKNGVKEFHLVAEPVVRELAPGMLRTCGAITVKVLAPRSNVWKATGFASS